ncbi:MAG: ABC transporter ATP-binding protein [Myxococcales bacterium]|nr:ABC transporter ATP-binding protein [Myxococcales bacterium]
MDAVGLEKVYNEAHPDVAVHALRGVSLRVERGEALAIVGPSGSGKSTMMHILGCLDRPTRGSYRLAGQDVAHMRDDDLARVRNRSIGFVFQTFNLLARATALENVELPLTYAGATDIHERALRALERTGIADRSTHRPNELSGGQRQRVAIARAIVNEPALVLADEPTGSLDSKSGEAILRLLLALNAGGTTLVVVTHDFDVARRLPRVVRMHDGEIAADGRSDAVLGAAGGRREPAPTPAPVAPAPGPGEGPASSEREHAHKEA